MEFFNYECLEINNNFILKKIDDILFCYPNSKICKNKLDEVIKNINLSKHQINLNHINFDKQTLILISLIFIFFNLFFIIGTIAYKKEANLLKEKKEALKKYNLPLTSFQLNAIYDSLKSIDNQQQLLRKNLEFFSKTPLNKNEEYKKLSYLNNVYEVEINTSKNLDNYFKKRFIIKSSKFNKNLYKAVLSNE